MFFIVCVSLCQCRLDHGIHDVWAAPDTPRILLSHTIIDAIPGLGIRGQRSIPERPNPVRKNFHHPDDGFGISFTIRQCNTHPSSLVPDTAASKRLTIVELVIRCTYRPCSPRNVLCRSCFLYWLGAEVVQRWCGPSKCWSECRPKQHQHRPHCEPTRNSRLAV